MKALLFFAVLGASPFCSAAADTPKQAADFPVVDPATQKARDETRKQILEQEQATEKASLIKIKAELAVAEGARKPSSEILAIKESLHRHEANLNSLNQELLRAGQEQGAARSAKAETVKSTAPVQLKAVVDNVVPVEAPAPFWDVYRRQASNRTDDETKTKTQQIKN